MFCYNEAFVIGGSKRCVLQNREQRASVRTGRQALSAATLESVVKHPRIPVWPAWFGIVYIILDLILGKPHVGAWLEDKLGGRVCPMIFQDSAGSDPFMLVAHHRHSFGAFDPFRYVFRLLFPEGFPAHPHRGFETVTYVLRGGLVHRDSVGVKKSYGAPQGSDGSGEDAAVQWMTAGRGMLHEEMWRTGDVLESSDQELFQIWVNLPQAHKMVPPRMQMLGQAASGEARKLRSNAGVATEVRELGPVPSVSPAPGVTVRIIAGEACGVSSPVESYSPLSILHVTIEPGASWTWTRPADWSCLLYVRKGDVQLGDPGTVVNVHHTATFHHRMTETAIAMAADSSSDSGADLLILAGAPLREPVAMGANVIMNSDFELAQSNRDLRSGYFGPSWSHTVDDVSWMDTVSAHWRNMGSSSNR